MNLGYSPVSIANMALQEIGARGTISSLDEDSPNAIKVNIAWNFTFPAVLSERDWKFAKTRVQLAQNANSPAGGYLYAYALPSDFLRLCKPREIPQEQRIADSSLVWTGYAGYGIGADNIWDRPVWPRGADPYITETVRDQNDSSYTTNLLTNYPGLNVAYSSSAPIIINYIRLITDFTQLLPGFVDALIYRLASRLAVSITEDKQKAEGMIQLYRDTMNGAQAQTECDDYLKDEAGSQSWLTAGRTFYGSGGRL